MRQPSTLMLVLTLALGPIAACKSESPPQHPPEEAGPNMSGKMPRRMANCPSAVPGAITRIERTAGGAEVTITSPRPEVARTIVALAERQERGSHPPLRIAHSGYRGSGGRIGFCPTIYAGATITTATVPGGVRVQLRADSPARVKELQDAVSSRAARLPGFVSS